MVPSQSTRCRDDIPNGIQSLKCCRGPGGTESCVCFFFRAVALLPFASSLKPESKGVSQKIVKKKKLSQIMVTVY